jgi:hypothetical protein
MGCNCGGRSIRQATPEQPLPPGSTRVEHPNVQALREQGVYKPPGGNPRHGAQPPQA